MSRHAAKLSVGAQRAIREYDRMRDEMRNPEPREDALSFASFEPFTVYFVGRLIRDHFPNERFRVFERVPGGIESSILSGEADFGITYAPVPHIELEHVKICSFDKRIFVREGSFRGLPAHAIPFAAPFTPVKGSPTGITSLDGWPAEIPRKLTYQLEMLEATLEVCRLGLAAIFAPEFVVAMQNQLLAPANRLRAIPLPEGMKPLRRDVYITKRRNETRERTVRKLARALRVACRQSVT